MLHVDAQTRGLLEAVSEGNLPKVSQLLSEGCAVDVQDDELNTALMFAAESEPLIVELLLAWSHSNCEAERPRSHSTQSRRKSKSLEKLNWPTPQQFLDHTVKC